MKKDARIIIIGGGPAGLSCAYYFLKNTNLKPIIIEKSEFIGGISRTQNHNGNRIDLGGHRFFTKNNEVWNLWTELFPIQEFPSKDEILLRNDSGIVESSGINPETQDNLFLKRHRISRIYFKKKFFDYPISFKPETFINMGIYDVLKSGFGYLYTCFNKREERSLEDFYINRFGVPLYEMFFEDYTQKIWGVHPSDIEPDWGSQRVKGLSLMSVLRNCILKSFVKKEQIETSLIEEFLYPKFGPGQLYEEMAEKIKQMGGTIILNNCVKEIKFSEHEKFNKKITSVKTIDDKGCIHEFPADAVFSSMPVKDLVLSFDCHVESSMLNIARNLSYRDFITVGILVKNLTVKNKTKYKTFNNIIPDCWIYIQEKDVKIGRLQIFNNWSPYLVNDFEHTVWMGLEYFCNEGDDLWTMNDDDFIKMAVSELEKIGFIKQTDVLDSVLIRVQKAYPAYWGSYKEFDKLKKYLNNIDNLYCIGRNGQHRYNNMDHSILTGIEAVKSYIHLSEKDNIWNVNTEKEYHEEK